MQGVGALVGGTVAELFGSGRGGAATAVGVMSCASLVVSVALIPGLRRSRETFARVGGGG